MTGHDQPAAHTNYAALFGLYEQTRTLLEDFKWLLDSHPEEKGAYSDGRIYEVEEALRHVARHIG